MAYVVDKKRIPVVESTICAHIQTRADFFFLLKIGAFSGALETKNASQISAKAF